MWTVLLPVVLTGCGSADVTEAMDGYCVAGPRVFRSVDLPVSDGPKGSPNASAHLVVRDAYLEVDGRQVEGPDPREALATASKRAAKPILDVGADRTVRAAEVLSFLRMAREAGFASFELLEWRDEPTVYPPLLDPGFAEWVDGRIDGPSFEDRHRALSLELARRVRWCEASASKAYRNLEGSATARCEELVRRTAEYLPACWATNDAKVITLMQMMNEPLPHPLGVTELVLEPEAERFRIEPEWTWEQALAAWKATGQRVAWWE